MWTLPGYLSNLRVVPLQSNVFLSIFPMNTVNFHVHQTVNKVLARQNVEKTQLTTWFDYNSAHNDGLGFTY